MGKSDLRETAFEQFVDQFLLSEFPHLEVFLEECH